jgi:hypothetical protein
MKRFVSIVVTTMATIAMVGCEQFSTSYQRIDDSEFRMLKYIWEPADAAPGDTVTLTAVFAGKQMNLDSHLEWWVSFNVIRDLLGSTTVVDSTRLEPLAKSRIVDFFPNSPNPQATQAIELKFRVPPDIVKTNASIPENWASALPAALRERLPLGFDTLTKTQIVDMIEFSASHIDAVRPEFAGMLIPILQYFTVPMRVFTKMREPGRLPHTIVSSQNIRYNNRFKTAGIPVNNNPVVERVVVYKAKGSDVGNIDDKSSVTLDSIVLDNSGNSVIDVENGYTYFLDATARPIDTTVTMDGNRIPEKHRIYRQFQLDKNETAGVHHSKFMEINNFNGKITMPTDHRIKKFIFWLTVYDEAQNERLRPSGETLVEVSGRLNYK